jgi:hypothetical protein
MIGRAWCEGGVSNGVQIEKKLSATFEDINKQEAGNEVG